MPRFAANLSTLFTEHPFLDRFAAAADAGFEAVECQFPYVHGPDEVAAALARAGLPMVLHNAPAGDWAAGDRGIAAVPGREAEFREGVERAIVYARTLGCRQVNCLAGLATGPDAEAAFLDNLTFAADRFGAEGVRCLTEPINPRDVPGFFLSSVEQAAGLIERISSPNLFIQYDIYHQQRTGGEIAGTFQRFQPRISHIQIADTPGRREPGTGEINFPFVFAQLDRAGYEGWIGCEYFPGRPTPDTLGWLEDLRCATS